MDTFLRTLMSHQALSPCTTTGSLKVPPEYLPTPRLIQKYLRRACILKNGMQGVSERLAYRNYCAHR